MRVVLILNPTSGQSALAAQDGTPQEHETTIVQCLRNYNVEPEVWHTTPEDTGRGLAQRAAQEGAEIVIAAGGDGTIHAVACGLINTQSTLGIIALGTMNNIARSLKLPEHIEQACQIIMQGDTGLIDVGMVNDDVFLEVVGIGLEAALFPSAEEVKSPGLRNTIAGLMNGFSTLFTYRPPRLRLQFDERKRRSVKAIEVTVCNSPYYGVHFQVAPGTVMDDGLLDVVVYSNFSKLEYLRHAIAISQGRRPFQARLIQRKCKVLRVTSDVAVPVHADGVPHGTTPVTIRILPSALGVRIPHKIATGPTMTRPEDRAVQHHRAARTLPA